MEKSWAAFIVLVIVIHIAYLAYGLYDNVVSFVSRMLIIIVGIVAMHKAFRSPLPRGTRDLRKATHSVKMTWKLNLGVFACAAFIVVLVASLVLGNTPGTLIGIFGCLVSFAYIGFYFVFYERIQLFGILCAVSTALIFVFAISFASQSLLVVRLVSFFALMFIGLIMMLYGIFGLITNMPTMFEQAYQKKTKDRRH